MTKTIKEIQEEIIEEFSKYADWSDIENDNNKYFHLIELGRALPPIDATMKSEKNIIDGCQSKVWLTAKVENDKMIYFADSNTEITKGIISLLIRVFSNQTPDDIINANMDFLKEMGLENHLSPTRANGLIIMIKQMKLYALASKARLSNKKV
ncbi:MAG: SufE family protein [Bacteroidales bacterium]|jgi:cysteine desulfuration protein SufE